MKQIRKEIRRVLNRHYNINKDWRYNEMLEEMSTAFANAKEGSNMDQMEGIVRRIVKEELGYSRNQQNRVGAKWTAGEKNLLRQEMECSLRVIAMLHMRNPLGILKQIDTMRERGSLCQMFPDIDDQIFPKE